MDWLPAAAAVDGAAAGDEHERPTGILADEPGSGEEPLLGERVGRVAGHGTGLGGPRQHLPQERVVGITRPHPGHESPRHEQREARGRAGRLGGDREL